MTESKVLLAAIREFGVRLEEQCTGGVYEIRVWPEVLEALAANVGMVLPPRGVGMRRMSLEFGRGYVWVSEC